MRLFGVAFATRLVGRLTDILQVAIDVFVRLSGRIALWLGRLLLKRGLFSRLLGASCDGLQVDDRFI